jgi:antirestriction protein ArdC
MQHRTRTPAERTERLGQAHGELVEAVRRLTTHAEWLAYLRFQARFHTYSASNALLIWAQRPTATQVAGYRTWQSLGRQVRRGESGIRIFAPMARKVEQEDPLTGESEVARLVKGFRLVSVFDVAQTEGDELPTVAVLPALLPGEAPASMWDDLAACVEAAGFALEFVEDIDPSGATNGQTSFLSHVVQIATAKRDPASRARTLAHELAHCLLHGDLTTPRAIAEVEAESVAFLVADSYGMDASAYTVPYISAWGATDPDAVLKSAGRVQRCAAAILAARPGVESEVA